MPQLQGVTTKSIKQIWQSPDGQRTINEVTLDYQGKLFKANTFSNDIASIGWNGDVESYEKEGRSGSQTFVKQALKEGGWSGGGQGGQSGPPTTKPGYVPKDEKAIQAMWAISQSIAAHSGSADMDTADPLSVEAYAKELFAMVDRVKTGAEAPALADSVTGSDELVDADEPLDLSLMDEVLGGTEKVDSKETPWKKS